ncbi:MAG TPA: aminomethyl-transferring glycine dehydrogenase subunit GcvPA [Methylococcus sp.]|nr:aminomethyl-transferring glycine dehydrogenase subunit GcvPA [Methylococcus sp.]
MPFIPHTEDETRAMLAALGVATLDDLFDEIPADLRGGEFPLPPGSTEMEVAREMRRLAGNNRPLVCFAGGGAYEHHIPAAVWQIAVRGEYMSAYTPYQAEASQGTLQVLYEYQSMLASLCALEVSNASLYDGASALAEALLMAVRVHRARAKRVLLPRTVAPGYRRVVRTLLAPQEVEILEIPYDETQGRIDPDRLAAYEGQDVAALVLPQPNYFGQLEEVDALTGWAERQGVVTVALVNPIALGLLKPPGEWGTRGADLACGDGQPFGIPLSGGGPYFGFLCCRREHVHQLPGRLVARTVDSAGREGFVLTLQAREQHIRRGKATSNICTNQGLMATAATIHLALLGPEGLRRTALRCHHRTRDLVRRLVAVPGVERVFEGACFHEAVLRLPRPPREVLARLASRSILGGIALGLDYPELAEGLLVCATELRTEAELEAYAQALNEILAEPWA